MNNSTSRGKCLPERRGKENIRGRNYEKILGVMKENYKEYHSQRKRKILLTLPYEKFAYIGKFFPSIKVKP